MSDEEKDALMATLERILTALSYAQTLAYAPFSEYINEAWAALNKLKEKCR